MDYSEMFWKKKVKPHFTKESLEFKVKLLNGKEIRYVNLDNAATTTPFKGVMDFVNSSFKSYGSVHRGAGQKSEISTKKYEATRETIRNFVGASENNYVIFSKNTTEAINHAAELFSNFPGKILVSDIEHSSNMLPWMKYGEIMQYKTNTDCSIDLKNIECELRNSAGKVKVVAITGASNVTGYKPQIYQIARLAHKYGALVFVDCCQLIQHQKIDMRPEQDLEHIDFIAFSGHKMYASYGSGVLVGPKKFFDCVLPYQIGGGNLVYIDKNLQLKKFKTVRTHDPGSPNFAGAVAIEKSIQILEEIGFDNISKYEHRLVDYTLSKLSKIHGVKIYLSSKNVGSTIPFDIVGFDHRLVAEILAKEHGIGVRAGSFCTYEMIRKIKNISHNEDQIISSEVDHGITKNIPGLVRASFGLVNNLEDCNRLVKAIYEIIKRGPKNYSKKYFQDQKTGEWFLL